MTDVEKAIALEKGGSRKSNRRIVPERTCTPVSSRKEIVLPDGQSSNTAAESLLDTLIDEARAALAEAEAEIAAITAEMAVVEPHPYAHGHTARGDCEYAGIKSLHFLPLAGLLAQPWASALSWLQVVQKQYDLDYLLKAVPPTLSMLGDILDTEGSKLISNRADLVDNDLLHLFDRKPMLAVGMLWRLVGFDMRNRYAWVGAFAIGDQLEALIAAADDVTADTMFGDALAAVVAGHGDMLAAAGRREIDSRDARRDAERQASWAEVQEGYRSGGSWRGKPPTKRQRHMMRRIESARCLPMPVDGRRGVSSDAISDAGGNPRFGGSNGEPTV